MEKTRQDILENLDDDVRKVLKVDYQDAQNLLSEGEARFLALTRHVLGDRARFGADDPRTFTLVAPPTDTIAAGVYSLNRNDLKPGELAYRPNCERGEWAVAAAKASDTPTAEVTFDISGYGGKMSTIEALKGKDGWLLLDKMTVNALDADGFLLFTGFASDGTMVSPDDLERLFKLDQTVAESGPVPVETAEKLAANAKLLAQSALQKNMEANNALFKERLGQLDRWVEDQVSVAEHALAVVKDELRAARHEQDVASNQDELAAAGEKVAALERKKTKARRNIDDVEEEAVEKRGRILSELKKKMVQRVTNETLFTIRWAVI